MSYDLDAASGGGISEQGVGFGSGSGVVERDHACVVCGYNLRGLARSGTCPECGSAVERSFRGDELLYSSPEFVAALHKGASIVLVGIIAMFVVGVATFVLTMLGMAAQKAIPGLQISSTFVSAALGLVVAVGWWLLSEPDPASREGRRGEGARKIVRICTIAGVALQLAGLALAFLLPAPAPVFPTATGPGAGAPAPPINLAVMLASAGLGILNAVAAAVAFFAQMYYIRWLAPRLPSARVFDQAKLLMWLGPVLYTVGALCLMLGPLVALVLYCVLLNWVRKDLKRIREEMASGTAAAPGIG